MNEIKDFTTTYPRLENEESIHRVVWGPQRFRLSIGWKTLIAFALVVFIPMLGLMKITEMTLRSSMETETIRSLEANLRGAWRVYYERINNVRSALTQSAASPNIRKAIADHDTADLEAMLSRHAALLPYSDVLLVLGPKQHIIARRNGKTGQQLFLNNLIARAFTLNETITSTELVPNQVFMDENPMKYSNLDTQVMAQIAVVPVNRNGKLIGALVGMILMNNNDWLPNAIHDYLSIDAALFGSVIQESRIISASARPNNIWATGLMAPTRLNNAIHSGKIYRGKLLINDIPSFVISEPIKNLAGNPIGALSIAVRSKNIEDLIHHNARNIYLFIGLGILLSLIIAILAYRDTMKPMRAIMAAMDEFARGNLRVRTDLRTKDEFEGLGRGFNRMATAIQEHQERVESFNSLTSLLITSLKPKELLQSVLNKVVDLTDSQAGAIFLAERDRNVEELRPYVSYAIDIDSMENVHYGQGLPGQAAEQRRVIHIKHIPDDCRILINFGVAETLPREVAIFPIIYRDEVLGVMMLATLNDYHPNEMSLLEYMVNQIAVMLENALAHEQVERLSITDGLTGIYNRRYMNERLEEEFAKVQRYGAEMSVLLLDLDHFKQINDNFGHQVGDRTLVSVAECLNAMLRETDMLGRYGGEEFLVMLPHTNLTDATHTADKLRKAIGELQISGMGEKRVTVSIGVATFPSSGINSLDALVRHADEALYKAKESGRNRVVTAA